ncbi:MAG: hypothetical protein JST00_17690 [Deltaproteobacteria bacterium]|nr:hypothetical protein [Deltaproteobacteria bacterium]
MSALMLPHDVIRASPESYVGGDPARPLGVRLVAMAAKNLATSSPSERAVRIVAWRDAALTIGFDGPPLPIEGVARFDGDLLHPSLYDLVMAPMVPGGSRRTVAAAMLNALSEHMLVATVHDDVCYGARFRRGCIASLLKREEPRERFGASWLTFTLDPSVAPGIVDVDTLRRIVEEVTDDAPSVAFEVHDRRGAYAEA